MNVRIEVSNFAERLFPHMPDTVQALRCLISVATEIIDDIESLEKMMSLPVGTTEDPCDCEDPDFDFAW